MRPLSLDGRRLADGRYKREGTVWVIEADIWDLLTGEKLVTIPFNVGRTLDVSGLNFAVSPDGNRLVATVGGEKVWDAKTGHDILSLKCTVGSKTYSPDGKRLVAISGRKTLNVNEAQTGDEILTLKGAAGNGAFSSDGKRVARRSDDCRKAGGVRTESH